MHHHLQPPFSPLHFLPPSFLLPPSPSLHFLILLPPLQDLLKRPPQLRPLPPLFLLPSSPALFLPRLLRPIALPCGFSLRPPPALRPTHQRGRKGRRERARKGKGVPGQGD